MSMLYLASGSPRRRELLGQIGVPFSTLPTVIDETPLLNEPAVDYVRRLACAKAQAGLTSLAVPGTAVVLGADEVKADFLGRARQAILDMQPRH